MRSRTRSYTPNQPRARARARQVRWRTVVGMMSGAGMGLPSRLYIRAHVRRHTDAFDARVYAPPVGPSYRVVGDRDGRRVAEVSLTLDGVPVRIVILRDAQRRDAFRVSVYLPCIPIARPSSSSEQRT